MNARGRDWVANARLVAEKACKEQGWECTHEQKVVCDIMTYWPDRRKRDVSNGIKIYADAFEGIIYDNDRWLLPRYIDFVVDKENPRTEAVFYLFDDQDSWQYNFLNERKKFMEEKEKEK